MYGNGDSFPSGHALGSFVCYGALFMVFLPAARGTRRRVFIVVICTLIAAIGISRLLLGVHYLSDVLGAWALGITWLGITAFAFELSRQATGAPVTDPVTEGLEPEARADLKPAEPETTMHHDRARRYGRIAAGVVVIWVLIVGALTGIGKLASPTRPATALRRQPESNPTPAPVTLAFPAVSVASYRSRLCSGTVSPAADGVEGTMTRPAAIRLRLDRCPSVPAPRIEYRRVDDVSRSGLYPRLRSWMIEQ